MSGVLCVICSLSLMGRSEAYVVDIIVIFMKSEVGGGWYFLCMGMLVVYLACMWVVRCVCILEYMFPLFMVWEMSMLGVRGYLSVV